MKKGYLVVCYRKVHDAEALKNYGALAGPALTAAGAKVLVRTSDVAKTHAEGVNGRVVVLEFESVEQAKAAYRMPAYEEALRVLGSAVERDFRIVEGA